MQGTSKLASNTSPLSQTANENMHPSAGENSFTELAAEDEKAFKLRLEFANGNRFFFAYAYMLHVEYLNTEGVLKIYTAEKEIAIKGRGLDRIEEQLYDNRLKLIRESKIALVKEKTMIFVKSIEVNDRFEE